MGTGTGVGARPSLSGMPAVFIAITERAFSQQWELSAGIFPVLFVIRHRPNCGENETPIDKDWETVRTFKCVRSCGTYFLGSFCGAGAGLAASGASIMTGSSFFGR